MPKREPDEVGVKFTEALLNKNKPPVSLIYLTELSQFGSFILDQIGD